MVKPAAELRQATARLREPGQAHVAPAVAEPLAAWLHHCGEELSVATMYARDHGCDPVDLLDEPDSVRSALAVARAINQGGTE